MSMSLSTDMDRLTREIRQAIDMRHAALDTMRDAVKSTLTANAAARGELARDYRIQAQKYLAALARDVNSQRQATASHVARLGSARRKSSRQMHSDLRRDVGAVMKQAHHLQAETARTMRSLATANSRMAAQQKATLGAGRRKLHADMSGLLGEMRADRIMANAMWAQVHTGATPDAPQEAPRRAEKGQRSGGKQASSRSRGQGTAAGKKRAQSEAADTVAAHDDSEPQES